ncbi:MAG: asparagine synthase (glutamine-hydrolyzing) [Acidobacteria bacterium]|nr:asparagine synthase (glutamine-hydrolyzing) [Acidobacteriota bacterium]
MCGIAGYLAQDQFAPDPALLRRMCDRIAHRGPDAYGQFCDDWVALGHRRLSIIDVSGGDQPLGNEDGSIQIVFNGEIYNYLELRAELVAKGHRFSTRSDTEVIVHLYEEVGERVPEYLNGMFALAIWDKRRKELFLARDRFGKKPLYYSLAIPGTRLAFASELKALTVLPGFEPQVDPVSVADFLSLSYVPDPATIYKNALKLPAGHTLTVSLSGEKLRKYWELRFSPEPGRSVEDAVEQIRTLGADAVQRRMISDVPLGAFLSGGVDSSAVVAWMAKCAPDRVKTFSIGFTNKQFDELEYARMVVERYRTDHREQVVTPSVHEMLDTLARHYDEPFGDSSAIPTLYLARMTRQHVTVALSGDGADEVFGGYRRYYFGALEERLRQKFPAWFRRTVIAGAGRYYPKFDYLPQVFRAKTLLSNLAAEIGDAYFTSMSTFRDEGLAGVLSPDLRGEMGAYSPRESFRARFQRFRHLPPLEQMQAVDFETYLPGDILVKADRATMAYSLESRSPWLDYRIAELAAKLPSELKICGQNRKYVLKQAVRPDVPAAAIDRPKMGFSVPLAQWFRSSLVDTFEKHVLCEEMEAYLSLGEARRIWKEHQAGLANHDRKLWNLLMLASWDAVHRKGRETVSGEVLAGAAS